MSLTTYPSLKMSSSHTRSKSGFLQSMKVTDAMTYALIAFLVISSTLGYTSDDSWYLTGTGLGTILGLSSVLSKKYSKRELAIVATAFVASLLVAFMAQSLTLLLTTVVIASSKEMRVKTLLKFFLFVKGVSFAALVTLGALGIFDTIEVAHYSALVGDTISRSSINGVATNILHLGLFAIMILIIAIKQDKLTFLSYALMMVVNFAFYYLVSFSSGGLIFTSCAVLLAIAVHYSKLIRRAVCRYGFLLVPATIALFLYTGYQYSGTGVIGQLDHLTTGRIAYNHFWLETYGPTLFGVSAAGQPAAFDNSVVYLVVGQGMIAAMAILGGYWIAARRLGKADDPYMLLLVLSFYLFSMSESILPSVVVNPSLFVVVGILMPGFYCDDSLSRNASTISQTSTDSTEMRLA